MIFFIEGLRKCYLVNDGSVDPVKNLEPFHILDFPQNNKIIKWQSKKLKRQENFPGNMFSMPN